jgi:hypothetical protein
MDKESARELIWKINNDCYEVVGNWIKENWRRAIEDPVDTYITYSDRYSRDIIQLINDGYEEELMARLRESAAAAEGAAI